jgi:hypothetical protein
MFARLMLLLMERTFGPVEDVRLPGMKGPMKLLICFLVLILPIGSSAAPDDAAYCRALVATYENLVMKRGDARGGIQTGVETSVALDQCKNGNPAGIPVLEQKLRDLRIALPSRN